MATDTPATAQRFVSHGSFAVMPLSFPGVSVPIDPDESRVTALDVAREGHAVVGGTSGRRAHLFVAYPKPPAGAAPLGPVKCIASLAGGRSYGFCGEGIGRMFQYDSRRRTATDLGAVAGVLGAKRYAYTLCHAVVGPDGEIYFAEDDRGGHLWVYFPPVA